MTTFLTLVVSEVLSERPGLQRVRLDDGSRAYNLTQLTGMVNVGDAVVVNTTAVDLGLGTGGWHVVHWNLVNRQLDVPGPGHIMKLRYTSLQTNAGTAEELYPDVPTSLDGVPVVVCSLHSQMGVVAAAFAGAAPGRRLVYVMTDGAALPLAISDLVHDLRAEGLLCATVTAGHAFGGDLEAVTVPSALGMARHVLNADAIVVAMGPGGVGTGSALGTTALEAGPILDAVDAMDGVAVLCVRASNADTRPRHIGISHHTHTAVARFSNCSFLLAAPIQDQAITGLINLQQESFAELVAVEVPDVAALLALHRLSITTMGRGPQQDPLFFRFAASAGIVAAHKVRPIG